MTRAILLLFVIASQGLIQNTTCLNEESNDFNPRDLDQRNLIVRNGIGFHFETTTKLIRQVAYYTKRVSIQTFINTASSMFDANMRNFADLANFETTHHTKINLTYNWTPPPLFEIFGTTTSTRPQIKAFCAQKDMILPELVKHQDKHTLTTLMRKYKLHYVFAGIGHASADMTKRYLSSGKPFNEGLFDKVLVRNQDSPTFTTMQSYELNLLHDDVDLTATYSDDGELVFQVMNPHYKTDYKERFYGTFTKNTVEYMKSQKKTNIDKLHSALTLRQVCQNKPKAFRPPESPTEAFNSDFLKEAVTAAQIASQRGMLSAQQFMSKLRNMLQQVGLGLTNFDNWIEANTKKEPAGKVYLKYPTLPTRVPRETTRRPVKDTTATPHQSFIDAHNQFHNNWDLSAMTGLKSPKTPHNTQQNMSANTRPIRLKRALFSILSGVIAGSVKFGQERARHQKWDATAERADANAEDIQELNMALDELDMNQQMLHIQARKLAQQSEQFELRITSWVQSLINRVNPILQIQAVTVTALSLLSETERELQTTLDQLQSYFHAATLGHITADILSTKDSMDIAAKMFASTDLMAIQDPLLIPCSIAPSDDPYSFTVIFAIPLAENEPYSLIHIVPIKTFTNQYTFVPKVQNTHVALAENRYHYYPLTIQEYNKCLLGPCRFNSISASPYSDECGLEQLFGHKPDVCEGLLVPGVPRDQFIPFGDLGTIFVIVDTATATITCPTKRQSRLNTISLNGTGLLHIPPLCDASIVGTPKENMVRIRGPEATFLFKAEDDTGHIQSPDATKQFLAVPHKKFKVVHSGDEDDSQLDIMFTQTSSMVQDLKASSLVLQTKFAGVATTSFWLSSSSIATVCGIGILGTICLALVWWKFQTFKRIIILDMIKLSQGTTTKIQDITHKALDKLRRTTSHEEHEREGTHSNFATFKPRTHRQTASQSIRYLPAKELTRGPIVDDDIDHEPEITFPLMPMPQDETTP